MTRAKGKRQMQVEREQEKRVNTAVLRLGDTDVNSVAHVTGLTPDQVEAAVERINANAVARTGEPVINVGNPEPEPAPYKLTEDKKFVAEMVDLFSQYMRAATKADGNKAVYESFELDRMDDMMCGGEYEKFPQANDAINRMESYHHELAQKLGGDYLDEHGMCDQLGCDYPGCAAKAIHDAIYSRLLRKFGISTLVMIYPNLGVR